MSEAWLKDRGVRDPTDAGAPAKLVRQVRDGLRHLHDRTRLQTHSLARYVTSDAEKRTGGRGTLLQEALLAAIDAMRPAPNAPAVSPAGRSHHLLVLRYVEGEEAGTVQRGLAISKTEYYVEHQRAIEAVASWLWERWESAGVTAPTAAGAGPVPRPRPVEPVRTSPDNLPADLTSFVGRVGEVATITDLLATTRLVTLIGVGGCGKTRLALAVAEKVRETYSDGAWLVELAPLTDPALLPKAIAEALGVPEQPRQPLRATLDAYLRARHLLLVVDNCEHLIADCARLADDLLRSCPTLTVLATSREALGIGGEIAWRVPSLTVPDRRRLPDHRHDPVAMLLDFEAAQLFEQRARTVDPSFAVTAANVGVIADICWQLDGIPLALELAAARIKVLSAEQIAARLDDRFQLLTGGSRTALPRQQTLLATLEWSYNLLSDAERAIFRRISVFAGGFSLDGADAICSFTISSPNLETERHAGIGTDLGVAPTDAGMPSGAILDMVSQLVDKSLVVVEKQYGEARYRLLETVRQYGHERLVEAREAAAAWNRLAAWCLTLAEQAERGLASSRQGDWLERLELDHDNLRAALTWSQNGAPDIEIRLAGSLWRFWRMRSSYAEGRAWLDRALTRAADGSAARAKALYGAGILAREQGDYPTARSLLEECVAWWRQAEAKGPLGHALHDLGLCLFLVSEDVARVKAVWDESLALLEEVGDERGIGFSVLFLGLLAAQTGEDDKARALIGNAIQIFRRVGDEWSLSEALGRLGDVLIRQGDASSARQVVDEQLAIARQLGDRYGIGAALCGLARVARADHDLDRAARLFDESLRVFQEIGSSAIYFVLWDLGALAVQRSLVARGVRLMGAAMGSQHLTGMHANRLVDNKSSLDAARVVLGAPAVACAWAEGQVMTLDQAVAYALEEDGV